MDSVKEYSRQSLIGILFFMTLLLLLVNATFYYGIPSLFTKISVSSIGEAGGVQVSGVVEKLVNLQYMLRIYFVPASAAFFLLAGVFLWLYLRSSFIAAVKVSPQTTAVKKPT